MNVCYIVCALDCKLNIKPDESDFIIGADRGYFILENNGISPDAVIGDFDSYTGEVKCDNVIRFPSRKDFTDSELAIMHAIEKGYKKIKIYGAIGGALDHTIANLSLLGKYSKQGMEIAFYYDENVVFALTDGDVSFDESAKGRISVFSFDDKAFGVFEKGLSYEISDAILENKAPLGVSNEFVGECATISVSKGTLILHTSRENYENHLTK